MRVCTSRKECAPPTWNWSARSRGRSTRFRIVKKYFDQVVSLTQSTFGFHPVSIFDIDPRTGEAVLQASSDPNVLPNSARIGPEQGIVGAAAANRETIVSNNTADDPRYVRALESTHFLVAHDSSSEIAIPLIVDNRVLGVLDVQSDVIGAFNESEKTVLEALAAEVGTAIHKAQQFAWQQREAWISTAQLQVAEAISRSDDLDEVIEAVIAADADADRRFLLRHPSVG